MNLFLIILAAGDGKRLKTSIPKPFNKVNNKTLLEYSMDVFKNFDEIKKTIIVYNPKHKKYLNKIKINNCIKIKGGSTRQKSTIKALKKIKNLNCNKVLIHDASRPNPPQQLIKKIIKNLKNNDVVIPILKINDATKFIQKNNLISNINRNYLKLTQTPQGFNFKRLYQKHRININEKFDDDFSLYAGQKEKIVMLNGNVSNFKITYNDDLDIFKSLKKREFFYGIGFDVHKLVKGSNIYLGGIKIPFPKKLLGHSDGDPVLHALIDSLLGACKLGDIGKLFSNQNKKFKNIKSVKMLKKVVQLLENKNFSINNIDINIIAEKPKIKKYRNKIANLIGKICKIDSNKINIKGKTTEKLGVIGKGEAIASEVISSVIKND